MEIKVEKDETIALLQREIKRKEHDLHLAATFGNQLIADKEIINSKLLETQSQVEKLEQEKYSLQLNLETQIQSVRTQNCELELQLGINDDLQKKVKTYEKEVAIQKQKYNNVTREKSDLESHHEDLKLENNSLKKKVKLLEIEVSSLKEKAIDLDVGIKTEEEHQDIKVFDNKCELPNDEISAIKFFQDAGILHRVRVCSNHHSMKCYFSARCPKWMCYRKSCRESKGIRKDTFFANSRIPFLTALKFIHYWSKELTSMEYCRKELKWSPHTTVDWNNYMREVCMHSLMSGRSTKIGGRNKTVEIGESRFTDEKNSAADPKWVFGGICRETKAHFLVSIDNNSAKTLILTIKSSVREGSKIVSDCWQAYSLEELESAGFDDLHKNYNIDSHTGCPTQAIDTLWKTVRLFNKRRRGTAPQHLDSYLIEFMWRSKRKNSLLFNEIIKDIKSFMPPK